MSVGRKTHTQVGTASCKVNGQLLTKAVKEGTRMNGPTFKLDVKLKHMGVLFFLFFNIHLKRGTIYSKRLWCLSPREAVENSLDCLVAASQA